jgi:hypothetical protein
MSLPKCFAHRYKAYEKCKTCDKNIETACWICTLIAITEITGRKLEIIFDARQKKKNLGG